MWVTCSVERGLECRNPRVAASWCTTTLAGFLAIVYCVPLIVDAQRAETWVSAPCRPTGVSLRQELCTVARCPSPGPVWQSSPSPAACPTATTMCFACQFDMAVRAVGGTAVLGASSYVGGWESRAVAATACNDMLVAANNGTSTDLSTCYYQPIYNTGTRLYFSFTSPAITANPVPIAVFGVVFLLAGCIAVGCNCATTRIDAAWEEQLNLARERAADRHHRATRWSDFYGPGGAPPPAAEAARVRALHTGTPAAAGSSSSSAAAAAVSYTNPMHRD